MKLPVLLFSLACAVSTFAANVVPIGDSTLAPRTDKAKLGSRGDAPKSAVFDEGGFFVGCNYWASHAGMYMWRNWDGKQVERDLDDLASCGMTVLRVFPLWPDFQPLTGEFGGGGSFRGFAQAGGPLKNEAAVDDVMIARFRFLCDAAEKRGIKLVVGLVTGWMSGRLFVPPALERKNVLTDAEAVMWQVRFVRYFVNALKDHPAIAAWDLGNECNCMGGASAAEFWCWMHQVSSEIRLADPTRPVVSGMHSLKTTNAQANMRQQGELMDILTTHPYPLWTPNCNTEPFDTIRNGCHAACESTMYADLAGRTCFVEEAGSMGPGIVSEERAAASMRMALYSCWAAGLPGYCWWCAYDQNKLAFAPYDWTAIERELGLFKDNGQPKPTALVLKDFAAFLKTLPFKRLPARQVDAVVVVTEREDCWPVAQGAWLLARKAGFDIRYARAEDPLPEAKFYILPSGTGYETYTRAAFERVVEKAKAGATVLVTLGSGAVLSGLRETAGVKTENHYRSQNTAVVKIGGHEFSVWEPYRRILTAEMAQIVAKDGAGNPMLSVNTLGKGKVVYFNAAIERAAPLDAWPVYAHAAKVAGVVRKVARTNPLLGVTEHPTGDGRTIVVAVNYSPAALTDTIKISGSLGTVWRGTVTADSIRLEPNESAVFEIR